MGLRDTFKELQVKAKQIGTYENVPISDLADNYCLAADTNDTEKKDIYFSALVLRFWSKINKLYVENPTLNLEHIDYFNWVVDSILMACDKENRAWQKNEKLNAQQVINQILATRFVAQAYYEANLKKNKGKQFAISLETTVWGEENKSTLADTLADPASMTAQESNAINLLVQDYINNNKLIEAIIIDNIAYKDAFKHDRETITEISDEETYKYHKHYSTFWPHKLIKEISCLDNDYVEYFKSTYAVSSKAFEAAFKALCKANSSKKSKYLDATLRSLRTDFGVSR